MPPLPCTLLRVASVAKHSIYLGSICLEPNRWTEDKRPSVLVSEWAERAAADGFDGVELWENHALLAPRDEVDRLERMRPPVVVYNTYAGFEAKAAAEREQAAAMIGRLGCRAVKFNFGADAARIDEYVSCLRGWLNRLPGDFRALCECHARTVLERADAAREILGRVADERVHVIVHGFTVGEGELAGWFECFGERVSHVHVSARKEALERDAPRARGRLDLLRRLGFRGTFTIEFAEGVGKPGEHPAALYEAAARDLRFLRASL